MKETIGKWLGWVSRIGTQTTLGRKRRRKQDPKRLRGRFESLEDRRLLAIFWANETSTSNGFGVFGSNASLATQLVKRAIADWEAVIRDFNYDGDNNPLTTDSLNNTLTLNVSIADIEQGNRGITRAASLMFSNGRPRAANIELDISADGSSWYFDSTPQDDAEFTGLVNSGAAGTGAAFQGSFVNVSQSGIYDFYTTILHEIGHAAGILLHSQARLTPLTTSAGTDQINPSFQLRQFHNANGQFGVTATLTTAGGAHVYEGTSANPVHPNELMNSGRTLGFDASTFKPTVRRQISDLTVQILADAYGYGVMLPSTLNSAHAVIDSQTGTLLIQGRTGSQNDTITVSTVGSNVRVVVNGTTELIPSTHVSQIVIARNGGNDTVSVTGLAYSEVQYVVSTNQDSADAGTLGDGLIDQNLVIPGNQVSLRAAVRDANGGNGIDLRAAGQVQADPRRDQWRCTG